MIRPKLPHLSDIKQAAAEARRLQQVLGPVPAAARAASRPAECRSRASAGWTAPAARTARRPRAAPTLTVHCESSNRRGNAQANSTIRWSSSGTRASSATAMEARSTFSSISSGSTESSGPAAASGRARSASHRSGLRADSAGARPHAASTTRPAAPTGRPAAGRPGLVPAASRPASLCTFVPAECCRAAGTRPAAARRARPTGHGGVRSSSPDAVRPTGRGTGGPAATARSRRRAGCNRRTPRRRRPRTAQTVTCPWPRRLRSSAVGHLGRVGERLVVEHRQPRDRPRARRATVSGISVWSVPRWSDRAGRPGPQSKTGGADRDRVRTDRARAPPASARPRSRSRCRRTGRRRAARPTPSGRTASPSSGGELLDHLAVGDRKRGGGPARRNLCHRPVRRRVILPLRAIATCSPGITFSTPR